MSLCRQSKQRQHSRITTIQFFEDVAKNKKHALAGMMCAICWLQFSQQHPFTEMTSELMSDKSFRSLWQNSEVWYTPNRRYDSPCDWSASRLLNSRVRNFVLNCIGKLELIVPCWKISWKPNIRKSDGIRHRWWNLSLYSYHSVVEFGEKLSWFSQFEVFRTLAGTNSSASTAA